MIKCQKIVGKRGNACGCGDGNAITRAPHNNQTCDSASLNLRECKKLILSKFLK